MHRFALHNDVIVDAGSACLSPGQVGLMSGWGVFSTIRVYDGVLLAFEKHWTRMQHDAKLLRVPFPADASWLKSRLLRLLEANGTNNASMRVYVVRNKGTFWQGPGVTRDFDLIAFTADLNEWGRSVRLGLVPNARYAASPFAGSKILSWSDNLTWYEEAHERGYDEVVLLNERGEVAECTSANIFAAFDDRVRTPPLSSGCLPGITRDVILHECHIPGFTVEEGTLFPADLERADQVFITSTTRELLLVEEIEGLKVQSRGSAREALQTAFSAYVDAYVEKKSGSLPAFQL
jgi:branched-chain amino acid aminotransferase